MRVGILRPDRLGDTVVTLPVAGLVKERLPEARVVWITRTPWVELLEDHPWVDEIRLVSAVDPPLREARERLKEAALDVLLLAYSKPRWALGAFLAGIPVRVGPDRLYGRVLFTHRAAWSFETHMVDRGRKLLEAWWKIPVPPKMPLLRVDPSVRQHMENRLPPPPRVVLHPETGGTARNWPLGRFERLARRLEETGVRVVWTGLRDRPPVGTGLDLRGRLSLRELVALLSLADGVVVGATGVFHLAWSLGRPVVALMDARHRAHVARWGSLHPRTIHLPLSGNGPAVEEVYSALLRLMAG